MMTAGSRERARSLMAVAEFPKTFLRATRGKQQRSALSKVQSVDQRMRLGNAVLAFANCGRAVAHVRGSYVPQTEIA